MTRQQSAAGKAAACPSLPTGSVGQQAPADVYRMWRRGGRVGKKQTCQKLSSQLPRRSRLITSPGPGHSPRWRWAGWAAPARSQESRGLSCCTAVPACAKKAGFRAVPGVPQVFSADTRRKPSCLGQDEVHDENLGAGQVEWSFGELLLLSSSCCGLVDSAVRNLHSCLSPTSMPSERATSRGD